MPVLLIDALALGGAYWLYTIWDKRPLQIVCNHCDKIILSNTPWVCGACGETNFDTERHSILEQCQKCGTAPKAYKCHHCRELIFFSKDEDKRNPATGLNETREPDEPTKKSMEHLATKQEREQQIELAELELKLKAVNDKVAGPKIKSPYEKKKEDLFDYYKNVMEIRDDIRKLRQEAKEKYKDNLEMLTDANQTLDEIERRLS